MDGLRCTKQGQGETTMSNREPIASRSRSTAEYGIGYGMIRSGTQHVQVLFEYRELVRFRGKGTRFLKVCGTLKGMYKYAISEPHVAVGAFAQAAQQIITDGR